MMDEIWTKYQLPWMTEKYASESKVNLSKLDLMTMKTRMVKIRYGEGTVDDQTCQRWFVKFLAGVDQLGLEQLNRGITWE